MSKTNFLSTVRFLSLATAAMVTGPVAAYAATDAPAPKRGCSAVENSARPAQRPDERLADLVHGELS